MGATFRRNPSFNVVLPPDDTRDIRFDGVEPKPAPVACNIHPFMRAWVLVRPDQFATVTDEAGHFTLPAGLPMGEHRLQFWHEGRYLAGLETPLGVTDRRGRLTVRYEGQPLELGEIRVAASRFDVAVPEK